LRRLALLLWGTDFDPALRPLLAAGFFETLAGSAAWPFLGVWALEHLGASQVQLSAGFLLGALASIASGWLGGHLSDYIGRRPVMLAAEAGFAAVPLAMTAVGQHVIAGLAVMASFGIFASMFNAAQSAMVADLLPPQRREAGYASVRVANNLGVCFGPPLGGLLLLGNAWSRLFVGVFALGAFSLLIGLRLLPRRGRYAPASTPERSSFTVVRRNHPFLLFVFSSILASHDLRLDRRAVADLARDVARHPAGCVGVSDHHQRRVRHARATPADARGRALLAVPKARGGDAADGFPIPRSLVRRRHRRRRTADRDLRPR
jgi:predicted MFS family arabinose efflux permease